MKLFCLPGGRKFAFQEIVASALDRSLAYNCCLAQIALSEELHHFDYTGRGYDVMCNKFTAPNAWDIYIK